MKAYRSPAFRWVRYQEREMPLAEAVRLSGICRRTVEHRLARGWTVRDALTTLPGRVPSLPPSHRQAVREQVAELREVVAELLARLELADRTITGLSERIAKLGGSAVDGAEIARFEPPPNHPGTPAPTSGATSHPTSGGTFTANPARRSEGRS